MGRITNEWVPITHLISLGMNNHDGLIWDMIVSRYTDETRVGVRGKPIGFIDGDGFHSNEDDKDRIYKMLFTTEGHVMFFEKNRHIQELQDSVGKG